MAENCFQQVSAQDLAPKGSWPGFGLKRPFPLDPRRHFSLPARKPRKSHKLAPKGFGQDLAKNGRFPLIPEGPFSCRPASRESPTSWLQKAPGLRGARKHGFCFGVFCSETVQKTRKHQLFDHFSALQMKVKKKMPQRLCVKMFLCKSVSV